MQETRAALIDAALELFAKDGLDASLDAICERAGFTRGAFYVHFADRDALLVAAMEKVGATFLARMFAEPTPPSERVAGSAPTPPGFRPTERVVPTGALETAAARFIGAVSAGDYPLMAPKPGEARIQFHQLLDACARSATVRAQYLALVEASIEHVAGLAEMDRESGRLRAELEPKHLAPAVLATIIGAQTMAELGVRIDVPSLAKTMLTAIRPTRR